MNVLYIDGTPITGVYVDASLSYKKPSKRASALSVVGRDGSLTIDNGTFDNVLITYPVYMRQNFATDFKRIVNGLARLKGYHRIECSNDPDHFRLGRFIVPQSPIAKRLNQDGYYDLAFDCKPQRFLKSGEDFWDSLEDYTELLDENSVVIQNEDADDILVAGGESTSIVNPTQWASKPFLISVDASEFTIGSQHIYIFGVEHGQEVYIDCDSCEIYFMQNGSRVNASGHVRFSGNDLPVIQSGTNAVTTDGRLLIQPRWWRL